MNFADRMAYEQAIEDCITAVSRRVEGREDQVLIDVFDALRSLRPAASSLVNHPVSVNYLEQLQRAARRAWYDTHGHGLEISGVAADAVAGIDTPIGRFKAVIWRRQWQGERGTRLCWSTEYYLDDEPVTLAEVKAAGLAKGVRQRRAEAGIVSRRKKRLARALA